MDYRVEKMDALRVVGARMETTMAKEQAQKDIPAFWAKLSQSGVMDQIVGLSNQKPFGMLGVCASGGLEDEDAFVYYIAAATDLPAPGEMAELIIAPAKWAVFDCVGPMPEAVQTLTNRIFAEWLPASGYDIADGPTLEVYSDGDTASPEYKSQIWLPVVKRAGGR